MTHDDPMLAQGAADPLGWQVCRILHRAGTNGYRHQDHMVGVVPEAGARWAVVPIRVSLRPDKTGCRYEVAGVWGTYPSLDSAQTAALIAARRRGW